MKWLIFGIGITLYLLCLFAAWVLCRASHLRDCFYGRCYGVPGAPDLPSLGSSWPVGYGEDHGSTRFWKSSGDRRQG